MRKFFISNPIASVGQLLLVEIVIYNLYEILREAQMVKWPTSINRKAQHGVGKTFFYCSITFFIHYVSCSINTDVQA